MIKIGGTTKQEEDLDSKIDRIASAIKRALQQRLVSDSDVRGENGSLSIQVQLNEDESFTVTAS